MATPLNGSIVHGFEILQLFSDARREVDTALVCKKLSMNNATAHRLLMTLEHVGALRRIRRGVFVRGSEMERLGGLAERHNPIAKIIEPDLQALGTRLNESVMACRFRSGSRLHRTGRLLQSRGRASSNHLGPTPSR